MHLAAPISLDPVLILAGILFVIGLIGVLVRRNRVFVLRSVEIMLNAAVLAFAAAGARWRQADGQVFIIFILVTAAAEVSVGLPLLLQIEGKFRTVDSDAVSRMRG